MPRNWSFSRIRQQGNRCSDFYFFVYMLLATALCVIPFTAVVLTVVELEMVEKPV